MSRIERIHFANYKNLKENTEILFPKIENKADVVVFIGKNGVGKSSILQAIYGCCSGYSVSDFWFDSKIDKTIGSPDYWYEYYDKDVFAKYGKYPQVRQRRVPRKSRKQGKEKKRSPDYWETARPTPDVFMNWTEKECAQVKNASNNAARINATRWRKFALQPKYIDFRHNITAFDSAIFGNNPLGTIYDNENAKIRIIHRSKYLARGAELGKCYERKIKAYYDLNGHQISIINNILEKEYSEIRIIFHNYYESKLDKETNKVTILINNKQLSYSDAYAGTGESAIIQLIFQITELKYPSIIILDEPESSLHISAQYNLMEFLCNCSLRNGHQIFISTHSPFLIKNDMIAPESILVCKEDQLLGKVIINNIESKEVAFNHVGHTYYRGAIFAEDHLIKIVVEYFLRDLGLEQNNYKVTKLNGFTDFGKNISAFQDNNAICIADGDSYKEIVIKSYDSEFLLNYYKDLTRCKYPYNIDQKLEEEKISILTSAITAFKNKVKFINYHDIEAFLCSFLSNVTDKHTSGKSRLKTYLETKFNGQYTISEQDAAIKMLLTEAKNSNHSDYIEFKQFLKDALHLLN